MSYPPRSKTDNIMNYGPRGRADERERFLPLRCVLDCVFYINMPHQIGITICVTASLCIAMFINTGKMIQVDINELCECDRSAAQPLVAEAS